MSFNGNEGEPISLEQGAELTARYRTNHPGSIKGAAVGRTNVEAILAQPDCRGIRVYLGENAEGKTEFIFVGVNENGDDMLNLIIDKTMPCPVLCGSTNPLNSDFKTGSK